MKTVKINKMNERKEGINERHHAENREKWKCTVFCMNVT